jgi:hypothetical protein
MLRQSEDLQRRLLIEIQETYAKKRKLEASIQALDTTSKLLIDKAALRDIALHRMLHLSPTVVSVREIESSAQKALPL